MNKFLFTLSWFISTLVSSQTVFAAPHITTTAIEWNMECPLMRAILSEDLPAVKSILDKLINLNTSDMEEYLNAAIYQGNLKIIKALVEAGIDVKDRSLFYALYGPEQKKYVVKYLLSFNLNVDVMNDDYSTLLIEAIEHNHIDSMKLLLQAGANPEIGENGTPLMRAVVCENAPAAKLLISHGANLNARNHKSFTPYMVAVLRSDDTMMQILKKAGADLHAVTTQEATTRLKVRVRSGMTASDIVKQFYNPCIQQLLQESGAIDEDECDTPLIFAAMHNDGSALKSLIAEGVDLEFRDKAGFSALFCAATNGHAEAVQTLLGAGALIDAKHFAGITPAIAAAMCGQVAVFELLEKAGANMEAQVTEDLLLSLNQKILIPEGSTALDIAQQMEDKTFQCMVSEEPAIEEKISCEPEVVASPQADPVHEECGN